jgi:hypothetical protein
MRRLVTVWVFAIVMSFTPVGRAWAASQFSASAEPTTPGTATAPVPVDVTLDYHAETDPTGSPVKAAERVTQLLPSDFVSQLGAFGTCPRSTVHAAATGGPHDPPKCPANSVVGAGAFETFVPSIRLDASSDKVIIYSTGDGGLTAWYHVTKPAEFTGYEDGQIGNGSSPFGPIVVWDISRDADGRTVSGVEARLKHWQTQYLRSAASGGGVPAGAAPKKPRKLSCEQRARKIKNTKRRRSALRRCRKHRRHARRRARSTAEQAQHALFASTGCPAGKWPFGLEVSYKDASNEKLDASVTCNSSGPDGTPPPPACSLPPPLPCLGGAGSAQRAGQLDDLTQF